MLGDSVNQLPQLDDDDDGLQEEILGRLRSVDDGGEIGLESGG